MTKCFGLGRLAFERWRARGAWGRGLAVVAAIGLVATVAGTPPALGQAGPVDGFGDLVERVGPAVVNISTTREQAAPEEVPLPEFPPGSPFEDLFREFFDCMRPDQTPRRATSLGSGFVIESDATTAFIVTNNHVIAEAEEITVHSCPRQPTRLKAEVVGRDEASDMALLKVESDGEPRRRQWADSHDPRSATG